MPAAAVLRCPLKAKKKSLEISSLIMALGPETLDPAGLDGGTDKKKVRFRLMKRLSGPIWIMFFAAGDATNRGQVSQLRQSEKLKRPPGSLTATLEGRSFLTKSLML